MIHLWKAGREGGGHPPLREESSARGIKETEILTRNLNLVQSHVLNSLQKQQTSLSIFAIPHFIRKVSQGVSEKGEENHTYCAGIKKVKGFISGRGSRGDGDFGVSGPGGGLPL